MIKINQKEYDVLKGLNVKWEWMARDSARSDSENLFLYLEKPYKDYVTGVWSTDSNRVFVDDDYLFRFIQWEDEEPCNIDDLVREYESRKLVQPPVKEQSEKEEKFMKPIRAWTQEDFDWLTQELDILIG